MKIEDVLLISLSCTVVILLFLILRPVTDRRYSTKWRYFVWLIIALRLAIPFRIEIEEPPVSIPVKNYNFVLTPNEESGISLMDEKEQAEYQPKNPGDSAAGATFATLEEVIFEIWLVGAIAFFAFHIISLFVFRIKIKPHMKKIEKNVYICEKIGTPMMVGFFKPTVLLPDKDYSKDELELIIHHEMTHFKRLDVWYKLLLMLANAIHWFNPVIYFMTRTATRDMEYFCDDTVVKNADMEYKKNYSLAILKSMRKD